MMDINENLKDIFDYVDAHQEEFLRELSELCACRSVAGDTVGLENARQTILRFMEQDGIEGNLVEVEDGNAMISAFCPGEKDYTVLFYNHYDVVEEGDCDKWQSKAPFQLTRCGNVMYARGVSDNKGPLLTRLQAIRAIMSVRKALPVHVRFLFEGDEETASPSMIRYQQEHSEKFKNISQGDICFWENGRNDKNGQTWARFGCRGACAFDLKVTTSNSDMHGRMGAVIPSASWRIIWALASLKDKNEKILFDGFYDDIEPLTEEDRIILDSMPYDEEHGKEKYQFEQYLCEATGNELKRRLYYEPSMSVCGLEAGELYKGPRGIVPHKAYARISFYLVANQDPVKIRDQIREHLDKNGFTDVELIPRGISYPVRTPVNIPERFALDRAARTVYGKPLIVEPTQLGAGPAIVFRRAWPGIPVVGIGPGNMSGNHHAPDENLYVKDYINAIKYAIATLYELGHALRDEGEVERV